MPHSFRSTGLPILCELALRLKAKANACVLPSNRLPASPPGPSSRARFRGSRSCCECRAAYAGAFCLGRRAHPVKVLDLVLHGRLDLAGHELGLGLGSRRKRAADKLLSRALHRGCGPRHCVQVFQRGGMLPVRRAGSSRRSRNWPAQRDARGKMRRPSEEVKAEIAAQGRHVFRANSASTALMNSGCETLSLATPGAPWTCEVLRPVNRGRES